MNLRYNIVLLFCALILAHTVVSGCASKQQRAIEDMKRELFAESASKDAFSRAEPLLLKLKPGDSPDATGLKWAVFPIQQGSRTVALVTKSDGWIQSMSGGIEQAYYKFGSLIGRSGDTVYGSHVFGYIWGEINLVPKYILRTEASLISQDEYKKLQASKAPNIGSVRDPGVVNTQIYLRDIRVKDVQALPFTEPDPAGITAEKTPITSGSYSSAYLSPAAFQESELKLKQLNKGTPLMVAVKTLGGIFVMMPTGVDFTIFGMKGFLNTTSEHRWTMLRPAGVITVWGFGYVEGGKEVPKLALVFRNSEVLDIVPYTKREEMEKIY